MADIENLTEAWHGHSGKEVESFLKRQLVNNMNMFEGKVGYVDYDGTKITFWDDAQKGNKIGEVTLSGNIYKINLVTDPAETTFNVLSSATSKLLTFSASTQMSSISGGDWEDVNESHTYSIGVDNGSGSFREVTSGIIAVGATGSYNIKGDLVTGQNRVRLVVVGSDTGQQTTKLFIVNVTTLTLECNFSWYRAWVEGSEFNIDKIKFAGNLQKTLYVALDGDTQNPVRAIPFNSGTNSDNYTVVLDDDDIPDSWDESAIHTVSLWMVASGVSTEVFTYNIMFVKSGESPDLICINEELPAVSNFVSQRLFSFALYGITEVTFDKVVTDGVNTLETESTMSGIVTQTKNYFNNLTEFETESDSATVTITATAGTAEEEIVFPLDNSTAYLPAGGSTFYMNAANRTNSATDKLYILNQAQNAAVESYLGIWAGFSFGATDGWISESANTPTVLAAKAGCHVKFPTLELMGSMSSTQNGISIELKFKSDNIADYDTPVLTLGCPYNPDVVANPSGSPKANGYWERNTIGEGVYSFTPCFETEVEAGKTYYTPRLDENGNPIMTGIFVYPSKLTVISNMEGDRVLQSIGLQEGEVHHLVIVLQKNYTQSEGGLQAGRNICSIYMNGNRNIHFAFENESNFGTGALAIGQDSTDFSLYMMRYYPRPLSSADCLMNFINTIIDGQEFTRSGVRASNNIVDNGSIDYNMAKQTGLACMVVELNGNLPNPSDTPSRYCNLRMEFGPTDPRNFTVTGCKLDGQGTTSMQYYRWNLRFRPQSGSLWTYADGTTDNGKKGWFDGKSVHPKVSDIVAKKNYASAMQGHKMGATAFYDDLYKLYVGDGTLPEGARVAVYQYPVLGFQKYNDGTYKYIGLYTVGPHKGDKGTFGYDARVYPSLMSIEGPNHAPLGTRFLHAWQHVDYNPTPKVETLEFGGEEGWDANFVGGYDTADETNHDDILGLYTTEFKPAYEIVFFCSPYLRALSEMPTAYNTIAKINADVANFRNGTTAGLKNSLIQVYDANYVLYSYDNYTRSFITVEGHSMLTYLSSYLDGVSQPTRAQLVAARVAKFKAEAKNVWNEKSLVFHYLFCILIAATDNYAKNMYPFKFLPLASGGKWEFRQDDLDSILDTDNNGQQTKKYSVMPGDVNANGVIIYQGGDSALYALVQAAYADTFNAEMYKILDGCKQLAFEKNLGGATDHDILYNLFEYYFWSHSAKYFPQEAYNYDTVWSYLTPWYIDPTKSYNNVLPLTQTRGDGQYSERDWVKKHIAFLFSCYQLGGFTGGSQEYGQMAMTPASRYVLNMVPAIDLYPVTNIGGGSGSNTQGARTAAGEVCPMTMGASGDGQTTEYILGVDWLSYLGDMCGLVLDTRGGATNVSLTFAGKRLRRIKIGDAVAGNVLFNAYSVYVSATTQALEEFDARNTTSIHAKVDLSACKRLRKILFAGSSAISVTIPEGAQLEEISMPDSCATLMLRSLPNLTYEMLQMSNSAKASVENLYIYNCPLLDPIALVSDLWKRQGLLQYITMTWSEEYECQPDAFLALYYIAQNKAYVSGSGTEQDPYVVEDRQYGSLAYEDGNVTPVAGVPVIEGVVNVDGYVDAEQWEVLHATWPNLTINCTGRIIKFEDATAKQICVTNWGGVSGAGGVAGVEGEITMEQAAKVSSLGTKLYNRHDIASFAEWYYFGQTAGTRNGDIAGSAYNARSGKYDLVVTPKNFVANNANGMSCISNTNADTIVVPHITTMNQYFSYGLACTNLIVLDDTAPSIVSQAATGRSVTNVYVPDDLVSIYGGKLGASAKPLSQFIAGSSPYAAMVKTLYEKGILVRTWL